MFFMKGICKLLEKQAFHEQTMHQVTCEVLEPPQICLLDRSSFLSFLKKPGGLGVKLVQMLSKKNDCWVECGMDGRFRLSIGQTDTTNNFGTAV